VTEPADELLDGQNALKHGFVTGLPIEAQVKNDYMTGFSLNADEVID
jgi:hypothetical protein